jgi:DnaJ family protein C protein 19
VPLLLLVLLAGIALVLASPRRRSPSGAGAARGGAPSGWWLLAALVLGVLLVRMGLSRLAVVGGVALAVLRGLAPLLRFWPLFQHWSQQASSAGGGRSNSSGPGPRDAGPARPLRMSRHEALEVLGLDERATREDVQREYRRLIKRLHPDLGGSTYLTAKLNEARDVLS